MSPAMQIRVLGHLEATVDDRPVALGGAKQRAVLAMLGLEANRPVSADRLIDGLWGEDPPPSAAKMVQNYVLRLRKALADDGGAEIVTRGRAYELRIDRELVDACRLERLVAEASRAAEAGQFDGAAREALALFAGEPLADVAHEPFAGAEIRRLQELRLTAAELAIDADLATGQDQEIVPEIDALLAANPLRERLHAQRMLALYRSGRQAEALEAYRAARRTLVDEVGIEPTPELRELHDAILRQDPALLVERARPELPAGLDAAAAPPLIGREEELRRLRARWRRGPGLVTVAGAYGMGKTRLAAELAGAAHREGATVVYAAGTGSPEAALVAIARARAARGPVLLVLDDADRAAAAVRAAAREAAVGAAFPGAAAAGSPAFLLLATGQEAAALRRLEPDEALVLGPLDALGVRAIAGFYAPSGRDAPVDTLLAASGGVPRRVHEAAREWARREATRRVDEAAGRAADGRSHARAVEVELADSVADLQSTRERSEPATAGTLTCPYKGLATFGVDDAPYFFGRERLVAELVAHLVGAPLLAVVGPSGTGKSSVLRAGLLPALAGGVLPGSQGWAQAIVRPGAHPLPQLRRATRKLEREWRSVLVVDQFEELFTACADEAERADFIAALVRWALDRDGGAVVIAIRADFYGRCAAYPDLSALLGANHVLVGPMARDELARAIERPAERAGLSAEPELVEALLADVEGRPGALPLLSTALLELWRERDGRHLRLAAYARSGGVQGAVARLAEAAYLELEPEQRPAARALLLRLTDEDESGALVRRRAELSEVDAELAGRLADRRLLTVDEGTVEVAHEALLREWPRLRGWLDEDVQGRRLHRRLTTAARARQRGDGDLYRGAQLAAALEWAAAHTGELNAAERAFLDASRRASTRAQRRLRAVLAGVASLLVLAVIGGVVALQQRGRARDQATVAAAQGLGARALAESDLDTALLLARQGVALHDSVETRGNLLATLLRSPAAIGVLGGAGQVTSLALSADGRTLALSSDDGRLRFFDLRARRFIGRPVSVAAVARGPAGPPDFSPDGARVAVENEIIDVRSQRRVVVRLDTTETEVRLRFSPDGRTVLGLIAYGSGAIGLQRFSARTGRPVGAGRIVSRPRGGAAFAGEPGLSFAFDRHRLITTSAEGPTVVRDPRSFVALDRIAGGTRAADLSPDGRTLLLGGSDGSVRFVDLATGRTRTGAAHHGDVVVGAAFDAAGGRAVTAGADNRVIVWDVARAAPADTLEGQTGRITGLAISPDGRTLYTSALAGRVLVWDLAGDRRLGRPFMLGRPSAIRFGTGQAAFPHALSPDGTVLAVGAADGSVTAIDVRTLRPLYRTHAANRAILTLAFAPGDGPLVAGAFDGTLALLDARRGTVVQRVPGGPGYEAAISFGADGHRMATLSFTAGIQLWTLRAGRVVGAPRLYLPRSGVTSLSLSPDGRRLAMAGDRGIEVIDTATLARPVRLAASGTVRYLVQFTSDGRSIVGGSEQGWARLWSAATLGPVTRPLGGGAAPAQWASVSPDGGTLATGSTDGDVRLFDLTTQRQIGAPLPAVPDQPTAPVFTPDGAYLLALSGAGRAYRWDVRPAAWERQACAVAGRTLTRAEWADVMPGRPYAPACR